MSKDLAGALASIAEHRHACSVEIILVNKPSGDGTEELIASQYPDVRLFEHPRFGFATMRNKGIRESRGRYCLILDTDIEVLPDCFDSMLKFMDAHPLVGGCGGHTTRLNGDLEYNVKRFYDLATVIARRSPLDKHWPDNPWNRHHMMKDKDHTRAFEGDWMAGACFCIRAEAVQQVGFFDESMHYFEDVDWCWRAKRAGWQIAFCAEARIIHKVQALSKKSFNRNTVIHLKSGIRFWWKTRSNGLNLAWAKRPMPRSQDALAASTGASAEDRPDLSVIIVNYNAKRLLHDSLSSIPPASEGIRVQVIVVDNDSHDGSVDMVREEFKDVQVIANTRNRGFTQGNNQGFEIATGRHLLLLNNDTRVMPGAFTKAIGYLDAEPRIGVAGLQLLNEDGSLQLSCRRFPSFSQALFSRYSLLTTLFPRNRFSRAYLMTDIQRDAIQDVDWVSGACLFIRRELLDRIGPLDERFFMYSEDVDYCFRAWEAGYRVTYLPFAKVVHLIGQSSRRKRFMTVWERHKSMYRFYKKHYSRDLMFLDFTTATMVGLRCALQLSLAALERLVPQKPKRHEA